MSSEGIGRTISTYNTVIYIDKGYTRAYIHYTLCYEERVPVMYHE